MIVRKLISWRKRNGLSQRAATEVMQAHDFGVSIWTLRNWEHGRRKPGKLASKALSTFMEQHPRIENPPRYRPGPKPAK